MDESNQQASSRDIDLSWLAAALESEGWFIFDVSDRRKKGRQIEINPRVGICNSDWSFTQTCNDICRKWITGCYLNVKIRDRNPGKHSASHQVVWTGMKRVKKLIDAILPYVRSIRKRQAARLLLDFIDDRFNQTPDGNYKPFTNKQIATLIELKRLNGKRNGIAKGTLEKLQRLQTEQYRKRADDIVQTAY